jgi:hypothetical protein
MNIATINSKDITLVIGHQTRKKPSSTSSHPTCQSPEHIYLRLESNGTATSAQQDFLIPHIFLQYLPELA